MAQNTIVFHDPPSIVGTYAVAGPKESQGPIGEYIHQKLSDDKFGENTFEKAERKMLSYAIGHVLADNGVRHGKVDAILSGDLLNQIVSASFAARDFSIPLIGLYSACSTMSESLAVAACLLSGGFAETVVCATGSHFAAAERQYRFPLELGSTRPPCSQWTVTGAGAFLLKKGGEGVRITSATFGKVVDFGVTDANNMGAAMAPAAADTLLRYFENTGERPEDFDCILTGDLGAYGGSVLEKLMAESGYSIQKNHRDCGTLIYKMDEDDYQGGSGAGCSAVTLASFIYKKMRERPSRILFAATGALLSTTTSQQGESIPGIAHAVTLESGL